MDTAHRWWFRGRAARLARSSRTVILDTETTHLDGEVAIIQATTGQELLSSLVRPARPISPEATAIHGISNTMCAQAPTLNELAPKIARLLEGRTVLAWNAAFDQRLIEQELAASGQRLRRVRWVCLMRLDARLRRGRWRRLDGGHRALGDVLAARRELLAMAGAAQ